MATRCVNYSLKSIVEAYKKMDALKFKRGFIQDLKTLAFAQNCSMQQIKAQFFNIWQSPNYRNTGEYSLIQMNMLIDAIGHMDISPTCNNFECKFCHSKIDDEDGIIDQKKEKKKPKYKVCQTLRDIMTSSLEQLSMNIMESSITPIILEMTMKIAEYLTDDEKQECHLAIQKIVSVLGDAGWEGDGFTRAPNKQTICNSLIAIIMQ